MREVDRIFNSLLEQRAGLPSGYERLEYITNPSTAYINTGVTYSADDLVEAHFENLTYSGTSWIGIFGTSKAVSSVWHRHILAYDGMGVGTYQVLFGQSQQNLASGTMGITGVTLDMAYSNGSQSVTITDGGIARTYTTSFAEGSVVSLYPAFLFAYNRNGVASYYMPGSMGDFSLKVNDVKVCDYLPVRRLSDGKVGMYDLVTSTFKTSASSVDFVAPI